MARRSREEAARTRDRIIDAAAGLVRERGMDGVSVAEIMAAAGLTHGGFYKHFDSKEALCAAAIDRASAAVTSRMAAGGLEALAGEYLSTLHRASPAQGCVVAALAGEAARAAGEPRAAFTAAVNDLLTAIARRLPDAGARRRTRAAGIMATAVGGLILARAVDDPALSDDILRAARSAIAG